MTKGRSSDRPSFVRPDVGPADIKNEMIGLFRPALAFAVVMAWSSVAWPCSIEQSLLRPRLTPEQLTRRMLDDAEFIVRARAEALLSNKGPITGDPSKDDTDVRFRVLEVLKGRHVPRTIRFYGWLVDRDERNEETVPYTRARPSAAGICNAFGHRRGGQYLLFLRRDSENRLYPYWGALQPTNEQLFGGRRDPWFVWVAATVKDAGMSPWSKRPLVLSLAGLRIGTPSGEAAAFRAFGQGCRREIGQERELSFLDASRRTAVIVGLDEGGRLQALNAVSRPQVDTAAVSTIAETCEVNHVTSAGVDVQPTIEYGLKLGMSQAEVKAILGPPDQVEESEYSGVEFIYIEEAATEPRVRRSYEGRYRFRDGRLIEISLYDGPR